MSGLSVQENDGNDESNMLIVTIEELLTFPWEIGRSWHKKLAIIYTLTIILFIFKIK